MTDRQTDRQTELRWLRRAIAVPAVARKNVMQNMKRCKCLWVIVVIVVVVVVVVAVLAVAGETEP